MTPDVCDCVVRWPVAHEGHCCGTRCVRHDPLVAAAVAAAGGWGAWVHTAPSARRAILSRHQGMTGPLQDGGARGTH